MTVSVGRPGPGGSILSMSVLLSDPHEVCGRYRCSSFLLSYTVVLYTFLSQHTTLHTIIRQSKIKRRRENSKQLTGAWTRARSTAAASLPTPAPAPWHKHRSGTSWRRGLGYGLPVSARHRYFWCFPAKRSPIERYFGAKSLRASPVPATGWREETQSSF